jgi:hypothetical protein
VSLFCINHKNVVFLSHTLLPFSPNITKNTQAVNKFIDWRVYELNMALISFSSLAITGSLMNKIPTRCSKSSLFFFVLRSTCFGRYIHPSSGASTVQAGVV